MALDDILAAIRTETEAEIAAIRSTGEARAAAAVARAKKEASAIEAAAATSMDEVASQRRDRIVNRARLEADRMLRAAAERVYAETVAEAVQRLVAVRNTPAYGRLLGDLLEECLAVLPDARTVRVDRSDGELIESLLAERRIHNLAVASDLETAGGVVLDTDDGRRVVNTFESRRARAERYLRRIAVETIPALTGDRQ